MRLMKTPIPSLKAEYAIRARGFSHIAGVDEAGRGSIFGPVCVGMVVFDLDQAEQVQKSLADVRDSKKLQRSKVYRLADTVKLAAQAWGIGSASAQEVDRLNIMGAIKLAAGRALESLENVFDLQVDFLLTDSRLPAPAGFDPMRQESRVHGDMYCLTVASASILAKQHHDLLVRELARDYDDAYQLHSNVGYSTIAHKQAIRELGPTPHHRHSFKPIAQPPLLHPD